MCVQNQKGAWVYFYHNPEVAYSCIVEHWKNTQFALSLWIVLICSCFFILSDCLKKYQQAECQKYFSYWTCPNFFFFMLLMNRVCVRPPAIQSVLNGSFFFKIQEKSCVCKQIN